MVDALKQQNFATSAEITKSKGRKAECMVSAERGSKHNAVAPQ